MSTHEILPLVERARLGDRSAYGELVRRFEPVVYAVALSRLRNAAEAQELTQEVFIHAMTKLDQLRELPCFAGWLRQITVRMAINRLTRRGPFQGTDPEVLQNAAAVTESPLEEMVREESRAELRDGLERLKPMDRETLEAFYIKGQSIEQMSRLFETPVGTIKRRLHVARNRLKKQMERGTDPAGSAEPTPKARRPRKLTCV